MNMTLNNSSWLSLPTLFWNAPDEGAPSAITSAGDDTVAGSAGDDTVVSGDDTVASGDDTVTTGDDTTTAGDDSVPEPLTMESITLPEGFEIAEDAQEGFLSVINDAELSRADMVNKLLEMQSAASMNNADALQTALSEQWNTTQTEWRTQLAAHKEIGGDRLDQSLSEVKMGLESAGATKEVFDALDVTGAGNHPALVPLLHLLTKPFREADPVTTTPQQGKLSREQRMFPNQK